MTYAKQRQIPMSLTKETLNGIPIPYKGFRTVLKKQQTLESIMGASGLQIFIIRYLFRLLDRGLDESLYYVFTGEGGIHIDKGNNLSGDVLVYEKAKLPPQLIDSHYLSIAPLINIEVDVDIDNEHYSDWEYMNLKTQKLLGFGVKKVVWILSKTRQVIVAESEKDWLIVDWNKPVEVLNGIYVNVGAFLKNEGVMF